ncbi:MULTISPECIES: phage integrase N-terminal SAM-like domain-containing protein [Pseudomonas]|uniref:phage integrase N-terminal SAM-like domain-containing protein n=1 Tax=Pseudomonas TaxID=286 RepID=UPI001E3BFF14|nr:MULTISPECIES: phage integrase N-terminal SAM-like domain-containing protein [Pseudomonas]
MPISPIRSCRKTRPRRYSIRTEPVYCERVKRFIRFHCYRHPAEMGGSGAEAFLSDSYGAWRRFCQHA